MPSPRTLPLVFALALACVRAPVGSAGPPEAPRTTAPAAPLALTRVPLRVLARATDGGAPALLLALDPDGTLLADGRPWAVLSPRAVTRTDGSPLLSLAPDGAVQLTGALPARLDEGALVAPDGTRMELALDGAVTFAQEGRRTEAPVLVEGVTAQNRATALCLVALEMLRQR